MQETPKELTQKKTWILKTIVLLGIITFIVANAIPIYQIKVSRKIKAKTMAPLIDEIYRFYQEKNQWPDEEQFQTMAQNLDIDIQEERIAISNHPDSFYINARTAGGWLYYYFITSDHENSKDRLGWYLCSDGTYYSYEPDDWPTLKNAPNNLKINNDEKQRPQEADK